jgi:hypothetical protein
MVIFRIIAESISTLYYVTLGQLRTEWYAVSLTRLRTVQIAFAGPVQEPRQSGRAWIDVDQIL